LIVVATVSSLPAGGRGCMHRRRAAKDPAANEPRFGEAGRRDEAERAATEPHRSNAEASPNADAR
jgi:hypothetical protein